MSRQPETPSKGEERKYDVFLAHNSEDKLAVRAIAQELKRRGIATWFDEEQILPGRSILRTIQADIPKVRSAAIFVGPKGLGPWEQEESWAILTQAVKRSSMPVIPVLLPGTKSSNSNNIPEEIEAQLTFALNRRYVSFDKDGIDDSKALDELEWAITGRKPARDSYGIIVQVHAAQERKICFLTMSKEPGLETIYQGVKNAVNKVSAKQTGSQQKLQFIQTRQREDDGGDDLFENIKDIIDAIRAAEVVIAVLVTEDDSTNLDPDVLYELGLAHALGKPLCIILSEASQQYLSEKHILKDIPENELIVCECNNLACRGDLENKVESYLENLISNLEPPYLTESRSEGILAIEWDQVQCLSPMFRNHFCAILSLSLSIHKRFPKITERLTSLYKEVEEVRDALNKNIIGESLRKEIKDVISAWDVYRLESELTPFEDFLSENGRDRIKSSFEFLKDQGKEVNELASSAYESYKKVVELLDDYPNYHENLASFLNKDEEDVLRELGKIRNVLNLISHIKYLIDDKDGFIKHIVDKYTGEMTTNLIKIICRNFEGG